MNSPPPRILVVDDDPEIRNLLARYVQDQGFRVQLASRCAEVRERISTNQIDLIVLDVMLPDGSGLDLCRDLRTARSAIPIILLTALKEDVDRIIGLEIGADDYLGKPFNPRELIARIRAVLRRRRVDERRVRPSPDFPRQTRPRAVARPASRPHARRWQRSRSLGRRSDQPPPRHRALVRLNILSQLAPPTSRAGRSGV